MVSYNSPSPQHPVSHRQTRGRKRLNSLHLAVTAAVICTAFSGSAIAQSSPDAMIADALRAAPPSILKTATVSDLAGNILREGPSDYTCFPAPCLLYTSPSPRD